MPLLISLLCTLIALLSAVHAAPPSSATHAFYATCSLQYHVSALIDSAAEAPGGEAIAFGDADVVHLWDKACACEETCDDIALAYGSYIQARACAGHSHAFVQLCRQAHRHLSTAWETLRLSFLEEAAPTEQWADCAKSAKKKTHADFDAHPFLNETMKQRLRPHLIPLKHAAKKGLDSLFIQGNPIQNIYAFEGAGFAKVAQHSSQCIVAKHPFLGRYLVKLYLFDTASQKLNMPSWEALCTRCESAAGIRSLLKQYHMRHFSVADKRVYIVPPHVLAGALPGEIPHPVILVVENMNLAGNHKSFEAWRTKITRRHLDELYCILSHGYGSTKLPQNVPYTTRRTFAFIDTEYPKRVFDYAKVKRFIAPELHDYWDELVRQGQCPLSCKK